MWWKNNISIDKIAVVLLLTSITAFFYFNNPSEKNIGISCQFYKFTHLLCPGCGGQRAFHALLHGRFLEAARLNWLIFLILPIIFMKIFEELTGKSFPIKLTSIFQKITLLAIILFGLIRNIL